MVNIETVKTKRKMGPIFVSLILLRYTRIKMFIINFFIFSAVGDQIKREARIQYIAKTEANVVPVSF